MVIRTRSFATSSFKETQRLRGFAKEERRRRWVNDAPNGTSFRQLKRAFAYGYNPGIKR